MKNLGDIVIFDRNKKIGNSLDLPIHFLCFISVLLIGADKWGFDIGFNIRIDQFFLVLFSGLLICRGAYKLTTDYSLFLFIVFAFFSVIGAIDKVNSFLYFCSIIYNVFFIFYTFENYVRFYGINRFVNILRATLFSQFVILMMQYVLKVFLHYEIPFLPAYGEFLGIPRFNLWFYEPSYLATYISFWFSWSLYMFLIDKNRKYFWDVVCSLIMIVVSTSTTGFIGIALSLVIIYFIWLSKGISFYKIMLLVLAIGCVIVFRFVFSSIYNVFIERLFSGDLNTASGGRVEGWTETFKVFLKNPVLGVGPGNYGKFFGLENDYVPSNITLELMATLGIFGAVFFYLISYGLIKKGIKNRKLQKENNNNILKAFIIGLIVFTVVLQINQGYLRLYHWMMFGFISGTIKVLNYDNK